MTKNVSERTKIMIVALEEAKRRLVALYDVLAELKSQLRIEETKERCAELERETMVQDFWNDAEINSITDDERKIYLVDHIHPTKAGYKEWWLPKFQECLYEVLK